MALAQKADEEDRRSRRDLEAAYNDSSHFRYLFNTQTAKVKSLESDNLRLSNRVESLLMRLQSFQDSKEVVVWSGPRETVELASQLNVSSQDFPSSSLPRPVDIDVEMTALLEMANGKIAALQERLEESSIDASSIHSQVRLFFDVTIASRSFLQ